jgi:hypothetical protein
MAVRGTRAGDYVTVRAGADLMAAVKLGDHDYVRLERAPEEAAQEVATQKALITSRRSREAKHWLGLL